MAANWGKFVKAKQNIAEILSNEIKRKPRGIVGVSTVTDPYQPMESKMQLTRKCLEILAKNNFPTSIQTKSILVLRDIDIMKLKKIDVGVTITTMDRDLAKKLEPRSSPPDARSHVLEELAPRGFETWIFLGPIIPEINDDKESITQIIEVAKKTKSKLIYDRLNLKQWVLESMTPFLEEEKPGLAQRLPAVLSAKSNYWRTISSMVEDLCKERSVICEPAFPSSTEKQLLVRNF
jgi:DNA repair photolyase